MPSTSCGPSTRQALAAGPCPHRRPLHVWPRSRESTQPNIPRPEGGDSPQGLFNEDGDLATPFRRLKLVMDYWCALWFWPITQSADLPSREQWWMEVGRDPRRQHRRYGAADANRFQPSASGTTVAARRARRHVWRRAAHAYHHTGKTRHTVQRANTCNVLRARATCCVTCDVLVWDVARQARKHIAPSKQDAARARRTSHVLARTQ